MFDLKQSMQNGGGPACLRLRVALSAAEIAAVNPKVLMSDALFATLNGWVDRHYRDRLSSEDLADPQLLIESRTALDELSGILGLGSVYPSSWLEPVSRLPDYKSGALATQAGIPGLFRIFLPGRRPGAASLASCRHLAFCH